MSYTPPDGYMLSNDGTYTYTATATIYAYNYDIKYGDAINTISMGASAPIEKKFKYKRKQSTVNVLFNCSNDIIINGNEYHSYNQNTVIDTINLSSSSTAILNILIGLDSTHYTGAFDISFTGVNINTEGLYLVTQNDVYYKLDNSGHGQCDISKSKHIKDVVGWMYTTQGLDYTFNSSDWDSNCLFAKDGLQTSSGQSIPSNQIVRYVYKFTLTMDGYSRNVELTVNVNTN